MTDQDRTGRRAFLAAVTATGASLAGCSSIIDGGGNGGNGSPTDTPTGSATATETTDGSNGGDGGKQSNDPGSPDPMQQKAATFEDLSYWTAHAGVKLNADTQTVYQGSQSARIESRSGTIERKFPVPVDLSNKDISLAMKIENPVPNNLNVILTDTGGNSTTLVQGYIGPHPDGWIRINPAIDNTGADMSSISSLLVTIGGSGANKKYWLDDIRFHNKTAKKAQVMFTFDYMTRSIYEVAFDEMQKRNIPGAVSVAGDRVGNADRLTVDELKEMQEAGWEITSMTNDFGTLHDQSRDIQRQRIKRGKALIEQFGLDEPAALMYPKGFCNDATVELAAEFHDLGFLTFNDSERGTSQSAIMGPTFVNRSQPSSVQALKNQVEPAKAYRGLYTAHHNELGPNADNNRQTFAAMLDYVQNQKQQGNVSVALPSDVVLS